jgi:hypothetical protein
MLMSKTKRIQMSDEPVKKTPNSRENPCPICGHTDYSWGQAITSNDLPDQFLYFRPYPTTREDGDMGLYARMCDWCKNVQFFYE